MSSENDNGDRKRYVVIRNGRGIIAHGDDMAQLESAYASASEGYTHNGGPKLNYPTFSALATCDHEGETGKVCILDEQSAPNAVKSYYAVGFVP